MSIRSIKSCIALLAIVALPASLPATAQEAELINDQSGGIVELTNERRLLISGLHGHISLRLGRAGEMQYMTRLLSNRRDESPVALLLKGGSLILEPLAGLEEERIVLEVVVPPELDVEVDIIGSILTVSGIMSDISVRGEDSDLNLGNMKGSLELDLKGGSLLLGASEIDVRLNCQETEVKLTQLGGHLDLSALDSAVEISVLRSGLELDLEGTKLVANQVQGSVRARARGGELELRGVRQGADLELSDCPLRLVDVEGGVQIETDALIRFEDLKSDLFVNGYGAGIIGTGNVGGVQITSDFARISLENIGGPVTIEGSDLEIYLKDLKGETRIKSVLSEIQIENSAELIDIDNEFGDITILKAAGNLKVRSTDGDVRVRELGGSIDLKAKGYMVEVGWSSLPSETDSSIANDDGELRLYLPASGRCRLEAESSSGNIESTLSDIRITDDGRFANGMFGGNERPVIRASAKGDIRISDNPPPKP